MITIDGKPITEDKRLAAILHKLLDKWRAGKLAANRVRVEINCAGGSVKVNVTEYDE